MPAQNVRLNQLLTYQSNGDITNNLQTLGAHLIDRVLGRVMIRKREVDQIDRVDTRLLKWHMIVGEGLAALGANPRDRSDRLHVSVSSHDRGHDR